MNNKIILKDAFKRFTIDQDKILPPQETVKRFKKPTFARVAPTELKQEISTRCDVVIEALAD